MLSLAGQIYFRPYISTNMLSLAGQMRQIFIVTINHARYWINANPPCCGGLLRIAFVRAIIKTIFDQKILIKK
ncbi:MAG: hypothetical protein LBP59_06635 [Planctomycetaceae bacterium]|nr:hypothetical protein [Planctomycetaceae bacterium]